MLTKLYNPSEFGKYAVVFGIVSILGKISSFRYEMTILLPNKKDISQLSIRLPFVISCLMNIFYFVIIFILFMFKYIEIYWFILPIVVISNSLINIAKFIQNKNQDYYTIAGIRILVTLLFTISALLFSKVNIFGNGLLIAMVISNLLPALYLLFKDFKKSNVYTDLFRIRRLIFWAIKNKKFLTYSTPAVLLNSLSSQAPIFLLSFFVGESAAGYYSMVQRVIMAPVTLVSSSINNVYMKLIAFKISNQQEIFYFTKSLIKKIFFPSILLSIIMVISFNLKILEKLFGKEWVGIDFLAFAMVPTFLFGFVSKAISSFSILKRNELGLLYQIILLVLVTLAISLSCALFNTNFLIFLFTSFTFSLCYFFQIISILKIAKNIDFNISKN